MADPYGRPTTGGGFGRGATARRNPIQSFAPRYAAARAVDPADVRMRGAVAARRPSRVYSQEERDAMQRGTIANQRMQLEREQEALARQSAFDAMAAQRYAALSAPRITPVRTGNAYLTSQGNLQAQADAQREALMRQAAGTTVSPQVTGGVSAEMIGQQAQDALMRQQMIEARIAELMRQAMLREAMGQ